MLDQQTPGLVFQPQAVRSFQRGVNQVVEAIRPTLGPRPRLVAVESVLGNKTPELLDSGGIIARRIVQLADRDEDMSAMFVRGVLWRLHERVGDGTATAAVLFQAIYNQGVRYITSGGNAMRLRHYLEQGLEVILGCLNRMTIPLRGADQLAHLAESICHDRPLAKLLGEIFDTIGEYGRLDIRDGQGRGLDREYAEGMHWKSGALSASLFGDRVRQVVELEEPALLLSDLDIDDPHDLVPILEGLKELKARSVVIVARRLSERCLALLANNKPKPGEFHLLAVRTPGISDAEKAIALNDLAIATGGRAILQATGQTLRRVTPDDIGYARRAWADTEQFGIVGGKGAARALRRHLKALRAQYQETGSGNGSKGSAAARDTRRAARAHRQVDGRFGDAVGGWRNPGRTANPAGDGAAGRRRAAWCSARGSASGGGVACLACRPILRDCAARSADPDERAAYRALAKAMEAPMRALIANAGADESEVMADIRMAGPGYGYDARDERVVEVVEAGILDVAAVQRAAIRDAVAGAALALTVDVLVHRKKPQMALDAPG